MSTLQLKQPIQFLLEQLEKELNLPKETLSQKVKPKTLNEKVKSFFSKIFRN